MKKFTLIFLVILFLTSGCSINSNDIIQLNSTIAELEGTIAIQEGTIEELNNEINKLKIIVEATPEPIIEPVVGYYHYADYTYYDLLEILPSEFEYLISCEMIKDVWLMIDRDNRYSLQIYYDIDDINQSMLIDYAKNIANEYESDDSGVAFTTENYHYSLYPHWDEESFIFQLAFRYDPTDFDKDKFFNDEIFNYDEYFFTDVLKNKQIKQQSVSINDNYVIGKTEWSLLTIDDIKLLEENYIELLATKPIFDHNGNYSDGFFIYAMFDEYRIMIMKSYMHELEGYVFELEVQNNTEN